MTTNESAVPRQGSPTGSDRRSDALLKVRDLRTVFRTGKETIHAVDGISFDVHAGETVGLVGESGSGKSVTARSILGLIDRPGAIEGGEVRFNGVDLVEGGWDGHRGDIAIVFQDPLNSINPVYTVGNQIREALRIHQGLTGEAARSKAIELLEDVGFRTPPGGSASTLISSQAGCNSVRSSPSRSPVTRTCSCVTSRRPRST